jgi:hypothetical protein
MHIFLHFVTGLCHESIVKVAQEIFLELALVLDEPLLNGVYDKIESIALPLYDARLFDFIRAFCNRASKKSLRSLTPEMFDRRFALGLFWKLMVNSERPSLHQLAMQNLLTQLRLPECREQISDYLLKCLDTMREASGGSTVLLLQFCRELFESYPPYTNGASPSRSEAVVNVVTQLDVIGVVLGDLSTYTSQAVVQMRALGKAVTTDTVLVAPYTHKQQLQERLEFVF